MNMKKPWVLAALLSLLLSGCVLYDQDNIAMADSDMLSQTPVAVPQHVDANELGCLPVPGERPCYCMTCENGGYENHEYAQLLGKYYDGSFADGACKIAACNLEDYYKVVDEEEDVQMRSFMLGSGQSFASSGKASLYCGYTLQLATKWMKGGDGVPPRVPLASRATCWLERSVLPVFIYYTGGTAIDEDRTREIAKAFEDGGMGPAILTTEVDWDGSDSDAAGKVKGQLDALDECNGCLSVLAVRSGDYDALKNVLGEPVSPDQHYLGMVDAVGFGFRANDYATCDINKVIYENIKFSRYVLTKYRKPTIWLYAGASEGGSSNGDDPSTGGCVWTGTMVQELYSQLLAQTGDLASAGVLGMSLYEFIDGSGPLPCSDKQGCDFGMLLADGSQKHPEINTWSDMCQEVNMRSDFRNPLIFSQNGQGGACEPEDIRNRQAQLHASERIQSGEGLSMEEVVPMPAINNLGCGEVCPGSGTEMPNPDAYDSAECKGGNICSFASSHCKPHPMIDERADDADISATYMRAIIEQESGFDPLAISCVDVDNNNCNQQEKTAAEICEMAGNPPGCKIDACIGTNPQNGKEQKPCAYGIAQCIEYPGENDQFTKNCGGDEYNPFDPGMSVCCGAGKFAGFLRDGQLPMEKWVKDHWQELAPAGCTGGMQDGEQGWAAYYLASNRYFGTNWNYIEEFKAQRPCTGGTGAYNHYIAYLRSIIKEPYPGTNYGAQVMSRYRSAVLVCGSDCPR